MELLDGLPFLVNFSEASHNATGGFLENLPVLEVFPVLYEFLAKL